MLFLGAKSLGMDPKKTLVLDDTVLFSPRPKMLRDTRLPHLSRSVPPDTSKVLFTFELTVTVPVSQDTENQMMRSMKIPMPACDALISCIVVTQSFPELDT